MIEKDKLKEYANRLMFDIDDEACEKIQEDFEVLFEQIDVISKIDGIENVEPMIYPFVTYKAEMREDIVEGSLDVEDVLKNAASSHLDQVKVPKVVE